MRHRCCERRPSRESFGQPRDVRPHLARFFVCPAKIKLAKRTWKQSQVSELGRVIAARASLGCFLWVIAAARGSLPGGRPQGSCEGH